MHIKSKVLKSFLEEREDYYIALHRLEQKNQRISLAQLEKDDD